SVTTSDEAIAPLTLEVAPSWSAGAHYQSEWFALSAEAELTPTKRFAEFEQKTQFVKVGVAFEAADWLELRGGYKSDLENTLQD
ncbi:hypothetical protein, partial [Gluconobacter cerinus]